MTVKPKDLTLEQLEIWFQDETRVGQQGSRTRIWTTTGTRARIVKQQQFINSYIYGAVCPQSGKSAGIIITGVCYQSMNIHLEEISRTVTPGKHAIVIMDRAGWHLAKDLIIPQNITLLHLPAYSPELNPQENVWQYIKNTYLSNRVFKNIEDITDACCYAWKKFAQNTDLVKSITQREWAKI